MSPPTKAGRAPAASLLDPDLHRFPWPGGASRRYGIETPWLAVVNARGPWGVWQHIRIDPQWLPLYRSLLDKPVWRELDDSGRVMMLEIWRRMAAEDYWGIVWGDPVRLVMEWGLDPGVFNRTYSAMLEQGFLVYLSQQNKFRVEAMPQVCYPTGMPIAERIAKFRAEEARLFRGGQGKRGGDYRGGEKGSGGAAGSRTGDRGQRDRGQRDRGQRDRGTEGQETGDREIAPAQQKTARHKSLSGSKGGAGGTEDRETADRKTRDRGQTHSHTDDKPANLPKSDRGTGKTTQSRRRSPSVPEPVGGYLYWSDPRAVEFGRRMYQAVTGQECPKDLEFAGSEDKSIVGVWAKAWCEEFSKRVKSSDFRAFCDRCARDVAKKRGKRGVRNLGAVAMSKIVPGIAAAMGGA